MGKPEDSNNNVIWDLYKDRVSLFTPIYPSWILDTTKLKRQNPFSRDIAVKSLVHLQVPNRNKKKNALGGYNKVMLIFIAYCHIKCEIVLSLYEHKERVK